MENGAFAGAAGGLCKPYLPAPMLWLQDIRAVATRGRGSQDARTLFCLAGGNEDEGTTGRSGRRKRVSRGSVRRGGLGAGCCCENVDAVGLVENGVWDTRCCVREG